MIKEWGVTKMKKILFLQNIGKSFGGVWNVNKLVGEELLKNGYTVHIVSIRNNQDDITLEHHKDLVVKTINEKDIWESYHLVDVINELKKFHIINALKKVISKLKHNQGLKKDIKKLHQYIHEYQPDYIVTSHYQLLDMIPNDYLKRTIHEQHSSLDAAMSIEANKKTFDKYKDKVKYLWLTKTTMNNAIKEGYTNSTYIYNAVRFKSNKTASVVKNKKLITIARISEDKSIDKMVEIAKSVFKEKKYKDWILEIYGRGPEEEYIKKLINNHKQIKLMGLTNDPKKELLTASINLNTSKYEGFSLSILEANECGIPTITFNFGESCEEQIINGETGIIANDKEEYIDKLKELMDNHKLLEEMSISSKKYSEEFQIEKIIDDWIELFKEIDGETNEK